MNVSADIPTPPCTNVNVMWQQDQGSSTPSAFSLPYRSLFQVALESFVAFLFVLLGLGGNVLVFVAVLREKGLRTIPNVFVVNLAVTDFLFSVAVLPLTGAAFLLGEWKLGMRGCQIQGFLFGTTLHATLITITFISINRFLIIRQSRKYKSIYKRNNVCCMLVGIWCFAIVAASRPFYGLGQYTFNSNTALCSIDKKPETASKVSQFIAYVVLYTNILIILRCYAGLYRTVYQHRRRIKVRRVNQREQCPNNKRLRGEEIKIAKTLFIVVCLFGICWFPTAVVGIAVLFQVTVPRDVQVILFFTVCLASVVNPIVYAVRNRRFRRTLKGFLKIDLCLSSILDRVQRLSTRPDKDQFTL